MMRFDATRLDVATVELAEVLSAAVYELNAVALLRAIADVESGYGRWNIPRHESSYCFGGAYHRKHVVELTEIYGHAAHCSYGPWQVMYPTAWELGFRGDPDELANPETNCLYAVRYLTTRGGDAGSIENLARVYNGGSVNNVAVPRAYVEKLTAAYEKRKRELSS